MISGDCMAASQGLLTKAAAAHWVHLVAISTLDRFNFYHSVCVLVPIMFSNFMYYVAYETTQLNELRVGTVERNRS